MQCSYSCSGAAAIRRSGSFIGAILSRKPCLCFKQCTVHVFIEL